MGNSPYSTLVLIALMVVAFYFLIIRPNKKRQQAQQATMSSLQAGTRVLMTSGIFGTIVEIGEKQAVLELSPGVQMTVLKQAIARATKDGDEEDAYDAGEDAEDTDEAYDVNDAARPVSAETYGASAIGTNAGSAEPGSTTPGSTTSSTGAPSPWSADGSRAAEPGHPSNTDQDPRSGTNTTPIKD